MADATRKPNAVRRPSPTPSLRFSSSSGNHRDSAETRYYALDAEMVDVVGPGELPARRVVVSIGVVNERLETLLYGRVAVPDGCEVIDGAFARMEGGLCSSWAEGIPASCVSDFLERHTAAGGVLVGWEIHNDLAVLGFEKAANQARSGVRDSLEAERAPIDGGDFPPKTSRGTGRALGKGGESCAARVGGRSMPWNMRVVEVTDHFRTTNGRKCKLAEAYACCFDRVEEGSHNAAVDARMTMELHNLWRHAGQPDKPIGLPLSLFVVNFHSFKPSGSRHETLWGVLRPDGVAGGGGAVENDSGSNTYKLSFRSNRHREAYLFGLARKMLSADLNWQGGREFVPGKRGAEDGYQLVCERFKMHVFEYER